MDESLLKEALSKFIAKPQTPSLNNEISGWFDDSIRPKAKPFKKKSKNLTTTLLTAQKIYLKRKKVQPSRIKKPPSLFQFNFLNQNSVKFKKSPKKLITGSRPSSSIKKRENQDKKLRYSKIILNKTVVFKPNFNNSRNFSPNHVKKVQIFRRSASSVDDYSKDSSGLMVHGNSCKFKLVE
jgi:hypothetical protein